MKQPWHIARPELRQEIESVLREEQRDLHLVEDGQRLFVRGTLAIGDEHGELDRFAVSITFPTDFPDSLPTVEEVGGRIPRTADRHINPSGSACLLVPEEWFIQSEDQTFGAFLRGPVRNFFLGQSLVEAGKAWPFGERAHGLAGVIESYEEILSVEGYDQIERFLTMLAKETVKGHWQCPCGSGHTIRRCHRDKLDALRKRVPSKIALEMLQRLKNTE